MREVNKNETTLKAGATQGQEVPRDLIAACLRNERRAQKELYDRYAPLLYAIIRRYVVQSEVAQEILNDTFFRVFSKLSSYSFQGSFEGWMRRIAVNIITDHFRRNLKHSAAVQTPLEEYHAYINTDSLGKIAFKELLSLIHTLPDTQRAVFNLAVFEDCPHRDIAQLLGISESNSRWHLNDARRRLKEKLSSNM